MEKDQEDAVSFTYAIFRCFVSAFLYRSTAYLNHEIFGISMKKVFVFLGLLLFLGSGYAACSTVPESIRSEYASGMFEAFITQSYGKSTIAFYQFDVAREKAKKAGENPLKIIAIERLFYWYRTYASSLNLYNKRPTGDDRIRDEYKPYSSNHLLAALYESEWGNNPEQAKLVREFMFGVGEIVSGVFCVSVGGIFFSIGGGSLLFDGGSRIFTSLNSLWANHQAELQALKEWEQTTLKPAVSN
ncbi:MAG: hypothetical protein KGQ49_02730 [Verrucomicrobia bacterium]|nr:hypothetical protein [Verrucomicrobiota bacterium]